MVGAVISVEGNTTALCLVDLITQRGRQCSGGGSQRVLEEVGWGSEVFRGKLPGKDDGELIV